MRPPIKRKESVVVNLAEFRYRREKEKREKRKDMPEKPVPKSTTLVIADVYDLSADEARNAHIEEARRLHFALSRGVQLIIAAGGKATIPEKLLPLWYTKDKKPPFLPLYLFSCAHCRMLTTSFPVGRTNLIVCGLCGKPFS